MGVLLEYTLKRHSQAWKEGVGKPKGKGMEGHRVRQEERGVESCHRRAWKERRPIQDEAKGKGREERPLPGFGQWCLFSMPWKGRRNMEV